MKKIILLFLLTLSFLNAEYLVTNGSIKYCATGFTKHSKTNYIYADAVREDNASVGQHSILRNGTTIKSGYKRVNLKCELDTTQDSVDLSSLAQILFTSPSLSNLQTLENVVKTNNYSAFEITPVYKYTFTDNSTTCTKGFGYNYSSTKYIVTPDYPDQSYINVDVEGKTISKIQFNYTFNIITRECYLKDGLTPYDLPNTLSTPTDSYKTISQPTRFQAYFDLLESANELPNPNPQINDITIDTTKASTNCTNEFFTLQDKLLCEINNHLRKINQESNPEYSINNLIGILNTSHNNNSEMINKEIKALSGYEDIRAKQQIKTNNILDNLNITQNTTNSELATINSSLQNLNTTLNNATYSNDEGLTGIIVPEPTEPIEPTTQNLNLDKYFKADETINNNELENNINDTDSLIDSLINTFTTFKTNITDSFTTINTQITDTKSLIINPTNIFKNIEVVNCPTTYEADFSSFGLGSQLVIVDYCHYMSYLNPIIYFFTYMMLMIGLITFTLKFIGVLL